MASTAQPNTNDSSDSEADSTINNELMEIASADFNVAEEKILEDRSLATKRDHHKRLILHWAACTGKERLVKFLLDNFPDMPVDRSDDRKYTPFLLAVLNGSLPICQMLFDRGARINHRNKNGHNALQYAASKNRVLLFKYLLDEGADPTLDDFLKETALHRAAVAATEDCLEALLKHKSARELVNKANSEAETALHLVCRANNEKAAFLLLNCGADHTLINCDGMRPIDLCPPGFRNRILERVEQMKNTQMTIAD